MSTLSAISKKLETWEVLFNELEQSLDAEPSNEVAHSALTKALSCSQDMKKIEPDIAKLVSKVDYKDPVTGQARYGADARAKILVLGDRLQTLHSRCSNLLDRLNSLALPPPPQPTHTANKPKGPTAGPIRSIDEEFKAIESSSSKAADAIAAESPELIEKARQVRERKAQEAMDGSTANSSIQSLLQSHAAFLERIRQHHAKLSALRDTTEQHLADPVELLRNKGGDAQAVKEALKTTLGILERIISRPDDANARRLRVTHPVLKDKLTGRTGGIELLCAIGFEARPQDGLSTVSADNKPAGLAQALAVAPLVAELRGRPFPISGGRLCEADNNDSHPPSQLARAVDLFPCLAPNTLWDLHLEMQEPAIETLTEADAEGAEGAGASVKLSWLDWFDGLGRSKAAIEDALKAVDNA